MCEVFFLIIIILEPRSENYKCLKSNLLRNRIHKTILKCWRMIEKSFAYTMLSFITNTKTIEDFDKNIDK